MRGEVHMLHDDETSKQKLYPQFDCVVMLTWSDWFTEPRSNRYHYATRFALQLPVLFIQATLHGGKDIRVTPTECHGIDVVEVSGNMDDREAHALRDLLRTRGLKRPLLWIYNSLKYGRFMELLPDAFRVYHATEDYFTPSECWGQGIKSTIGEIRASLRKLLPMIHLLVAVSPSVADAYRGFGGYGGRIIVAQNGCDAAFFSKFADAAKTKRSPGFRQAAIYQGAINRRLDIDLLHRLVHILPEWEFWFCGAIDDTFADWRILEAHPNIRYFGRLSPEEFAELMCQSTVGLIPYIKDDWIRNSLPLKAFEYVACELPVVTVPIDALKPHPDQFTFASSAEEFAYAMEQAAETRLDSNRISACREVASRNSYDRRFDDIAEAITRRVHALASRPRRLNILILYDDRWSHIGTIHEHLEAFRKYSRHHVFLFPSSTYSRNHSVSDGSVPDIDFSVFDVVIHHYGLRLSLSDYFDENSARRLSEFSGLKILFIQDEYDTTETARRWIERLKFDIVYTCVPRDGLEYVYPTYRFPWVEFLPTLTGFVPEHGDFDEYVLPIDQRHIRIGYRGRKLSYHYGLLGQEKYRIGVDVHSLAKQRGIPTDIEVDDSKRIYGNDWYRFIGSVRATLGTESGSNIFDFDGSLQKTVQADLLAYPTVTFEEIYKKILAPHEGHVRMNQVSPKIFEAIRLRTALILFEGQYSGVVLPDVHYIPLKKDYSNIDDVFAKLEDIPFLQSLTQRAFDDVIGGGKYSYRTFVESVDKDIENRIFHQARCELFATPVLARTARGAVQSILPADPLGYALSTGLLREDFQREQLAEIIQRKRQEAGSVGMASVVSLIQTSERPERQLCSVPMLRSLAKRIVLGCWRVLASGVRTRLRFSLIMMRKRWPVPIAEKTAVERIAWIAWRMMPEFVRKFIRSSVPV